MKLFSTYFIKTKKYNHIFDETVAIYRDTVNFFIVDTAAMYHADTIVFERLDMKGKIRGPKKQKLHMWKARYVQSMVMDKAHRLGMRISHVCAWGTSRFAFDGSGKVLRGQDAGMPTYSLCKFQNGKIYHCDLNASYNIAARYYIREILNPVRRRTGWALRLKFLSVLREAPAR